MDPSGKSLSRGEHLPSVLEPIKEIRDAASFAAKAKLPDPWQVAVACAMGVPAPAPEAEFQVLARAQEGPTRAGRSLKLSTRLLAMSKLFSCGSATAG
eukprot:s9353_g2.t1